MLLEDLYEELNLDISVVIHRFAENRNLLELYIKKFVNEPTFHKLEEAVKAGDYKEMEGQSHALKGVTANFGFEQLFQACSDMVLHIRSEKYEEVDHDFEKIKTEYEKITSLILKLN